jgi:hypothetical protein
VVERPINRWLYAVGGCCKKLGDWEGAGSTPVSLVMFLGVKVSVVVLFAGAFCLDGLSRHFIGRIDADSHTGSWLLIAWAWRRAVVTVAGCVVGGCCTVMRQYCEPA